MKAELKKWCWDYKNDLIDLCNNIDRSYLSDAIPYPYTEQSADFWLNIAVNDDEKGGIYRAIYENGKIIGNISVELKEDVYRKDALLGYYLKPDCCSKGIMTQAVNQICKIAFEKLDIIRITALVYQPNKASAKVLEKNGFTLEGTCKTQFIKTEIYIICLYTENKNRFIG